MGALEHLHCVVSEDVDLGRLGTPAGRCRLCVTFWGTPLQSVIRLSCRPAIVDGLNIDMGLTLPAVCDVLEDMEDSASVGDSAVLSSGDCGWTQYRCGTDRCSRSGT